MRDIIWRASFIAAIVASLIFLDQYAAGKADEKVMSENAYFDIALAKSQLDIRGPRRQNCRVGRVFFFYQYQTCFILSEDNGVAGGPGFDFIYHQPLPLLCFEQFSEDSYYFNEPSLGVRLATVNANNDVVYSRK